jgi:hypothetical protein
MTLRLHLRIAAFCVFSTLVSVAPVAPAQSSTLSPEERADSSFRRGREAAQRGAWAEAHAHYREAWSVKQSHDIAANLGQAEMKLGLYRDAAQHLAFALRHFPVTADAGAVRTRIEQTFRDAKRRVVSVHVVVSRAQATVSVDGTPIGHSPLPSEVYVEPGNHRIEAELAGHRTATADLSASAGEEKSLVLTLEPVSDPEAAPAPPPPPAESPPAVTRSHAETAAPAPTPQKSLTPVWIGAGTTLAAVAAGATFTILASSAADDVDEIARRPSLESNSACSGRGVADCADYHEALRSKDRYRNLATGAWVFAGIAATATVVYFVWPSGNGSSATHTRVGVALGPREVRLEGRF